MVKCGNIESGERVLIVTDSDSREIAEELFVFVKEKNACSSMIFLDDNGTGLDEPSEKVSNIMKEYDLVYFVTNRVMLLTQASISALGNGTRIIGMDGISENMLESGLLADYKKIEKFNSSLLNFLEKKKEVTIKDGNGTELKLKVKKWLKEAGIVRKAGDYAELPGGEVFSAVEDAEGIIVLNISRGRNVRIKVKNGRAVKIEGDEEFEKDLSVENGRHIGEFGIGTNPKAKLTGEILEEEKKLGTVHIAFGNNMLFGGDIKSPIHYDYVIRKPDLHVGDELIIKNGEFKIKI